MPKFLKLAGGGYLKLNSGGSLSLAPPPTAPPVILTYPSYTVVGTIWTIVPGTFSGAASQVDEWLLYGSVPITGSTIDVSLYPGASVAPLSTATNGAGSTAALGTAGTAAGEPGVLSTDPMTGTGLLTANGWTLANSGDATTVVSYSTGARCYNSGTGGISVNFLYKDTGAQSHAIEAVWAGSGPTLVLGAGGGSTTAWANNFQIRHNYTAASGTLFDWELYVTNSGTTGTHNTHIYTAALNNGDHYGVQVVNGTATFWVQASGAASRTYYGFVGFESSPVASTIASGAPALAMLAATGAPAAIGTYVGFVPYASGYVGGPVTTYDLILPWSLLSANDTTGANSQPLPPSINGRQMYLVGTYTGSAPTSIDVSLYWPSGVPITTRFTPTQSSITTANGTWAVTVTLPQLLGPSFDSQAINVGAWKTGAAVTTGDGVGTTLAAQALITTAHIGLNTAFNYYADSEHRFRDLVKSAEWVNNGNIVVGQNKYFGTVINSVHPPADPTTIGMGLNGIPTQWYPGDSLLKLIIQTYLPDTAGSTYTVTAPTGFVVAQGAGWGTGTSFTVNSPANTATFVVPAGGLTGTSTIGNPTINFSALGGGAMPAGGLSVTILPNDGLTQVTNPQFVADFDALTNSQGPIRFMTELGTNDPRTATLTTGDLVYGQSVATGSTAMPNLVALCKDSNRPGWFNIHSQSDSGYWTDFANLLAGNTPSQSPGMASGLLSYIEVSNETWNNSFPQYVQLGEAAYLAGYANMTGVTTATITVDYVAQTVLTSGTLVPQSATTFVAPTATTITGATWSSASGGQTVYTTGSDMSGQLTAGVQLTVSGIVASGSGGAFNGTFVVVSATSTTVTVTQTTTTGLTYTSGGTAYAPRVPGQAYASGAKVFIATSGLDYLGVWVAQQAISANQGAAFIPLTQTGNAPYWAYECGMGNQAQYSYSTASQKLGVVQMLYVSDFIVNVRSAFASVYGSSLSSKVRFVMMDWLAEGAGGVTRLLQKLAWNNNWQHVDVAGCSSYGGQKYNLGGSDITVGTYSNTDSYSAYYSYLSGAMSTSDWANFTAGFFAQFDQAISYATTNVIPAYRQNLELGLRQIAGYIDNSMTWGSYEGNLTQPSFAGAWPWAWNSSTGALTISGNPITINGVAQTNVYALLRTDSRWATRQQAYVQNLHDYVGGVHCLFDYCGLFNTNPADTTIGLWQIAGQYTGATSDPGYTGLAAYVAANP